MDQTPWPVARYKMSEIIPGLYGRAVEPQRIVSQQYACRQCEDTGRGIGFDPCGCGLWIKSPSHDRILEMHNAIKRDLAPEPLEADGWIPHTPGDPCPVAADVKVLTRLRGGELNTSECKALWYYWGVLGESHLEIVAYKLAEWRPFSETPEVDGEVWEICIRDNGNIHYSKFSEGEWIMPSESIDSARSYSESVTIANRESYYSGYRPIQTPSVA